MTAVETVPSPADEVLALHREGRTAAEFPRLAELLSTMDDESVRWAGGLLARTAPDDVRTAHPGTPSVSVAITGHGTLAALRSSLTGRLARHGIVLDAFVDDFDGWTFSLSDPDSALYAHRPDLTLCVLDPAVVLDTVPVPWRPSDVERAWTVLLDRVEGLVRAHAARQAGRLVLNTVPLPREVAASLVDHRSRAELGAVWREANARLLRLGERHPSAVVLDLDPLLADAPVTLRDPRADVYVHAHLSDGLLDGYAREVAHLARHLLGRTGKALVLDLDGTLWDGVLGDDGPDGVECAEGLRGAAFARFQAVVKQLGSQGVLLAVASKNDVEAVREALARPDMTLHEDDLVRVSASWRPKDESLRELAADLNLGVDAFVFVDDSPFECGLVRHRLPATEVVELDTEPAHHVRTLLVDGWFDAVELTSEDRGRVERYRDELVRRDFLESFDSVQGYLDELGVRVEIADTEPRDLQRVSQITVRTNQFNLTTERMQVDDVQRWAAAEGHRVVTIRTADRFGENGLVGVLFLRRGGTGGTAVEIANFLLSCRVFSRRIEHACLSAVLRWAAATGAAEVVSRYRPTKKNHHVASLYPDHGFAEDEPEPDGTRRFRHTLGEIPAHPSHIELTDRLREDPA